MAEQPQGGGGDDEPKEQGDTVIATSASPVHVATEDAGQPAAAEMPLQASAASAPLPEAASGSMDNLREKLRRMNALLKKVSDFNLTEDEAREFIGFFETMTVARQQAEAVTAARPSGSKPSAEKIGSAEDVRGRSFFELVIDEELKDKTEGFDKAADFLRVAVDLQRGKLAIPEAIKAFQDKVHNFDLEANYLLMIFAEYGDESYKVAFGYFQQLGRFTAPIKGQLLEHLFRNKNALTRQLAFEYCIRSVYGSLDNRVAFESMVLLATGFQVGQDVADKSNAFLGNL